MKSTILTFSLIIASILSLAFGAAPNAFGQWVQTNGPPKGYITALIASGTNLFAGTSGGTFSTTNNGAGWTANSLPRNSGFSSLARIGPNLFAGSGSGVFRSTDNGTSWTNVGLKSNYVPALAVIGTNLFAGTDQSGVVLSTDNGTSWNAVDSGLTSPDIAFLAVSGARLFAATKYNGSGTEDGVYLSTDNGTSWTNVSGFTSGFISALAVSDTNIFASTLSGGVFRSTNNGASWTPVNAGLTANTTVRVLAVSGTNLFAGTDQNGIFLTTDNGTTWTPVDSGLTRADVAFIAVCGTNLFAGVTSDSTVWRRPLSEMVGSNGGGVVGDSLVITLKSGQTVKNALTQIQNITFENVSSGVSTPESPTKGLAINGNYPNPFDRTTNISFDLPADGNSTIDIFNINGIRVRTLTCNGCHAGSNSLQWDCSDESSNPVPSGVYYYEVRFNGEVQARKMIVTR